MTERSLRVGFIGVGDQGGPMARRIVDAGFVTTLWARRAAALEPFADTAATIAATPRDLGAASDLVGVCVLADADVIEVVEGVLDGMAPGGVIAVHSTTHPDTCRDLSARAARRGVALVDAPVSGGGVLASERRLLVMVGGDAEVVERCRPVFETYGNPVIHLGPVGSGQLAKLINNLLFAAHMGLGTRAFALAESVGIEPGELAKVLAHGSGGSYALGVLANTGYSAAVTGAHAGPLLRKDARTVFDVAAASGASLEVLRNVVNDALSIMGVGDHHPTGASAT
jgi:3-hydroxyisobutyrate dehydrogenase